MLQTSFFFTGENAWVNPATAPTGWANCITLSNPWSGTTEEDGVEQISDSCDDEYEFDPTQASFKADIDRFLRFQECVYTKAVHKSALAYVFNRKLELALQACSLLNEYIMYIYINIISVKMSCKSRAFFADYLIQTAGEAMASAWRGHQ